MSSQARRSAVAFLAIATHNAEEAIFARSWTLANNQLLTGYIGPELPAFWSGPWFKPSLIALTVVVLVVAIWAARAPQHTAGVYVLSGVSALFAANALFPHVGAALAIRTYVPGVVTAAVIVLPATGWVLNSTVRDGYATRRAVFISATAGVALYGALLGGAIIR